MNKHYNVNSLWRLKNDLRNLRFIIKLKNGRHFKNNNITESKKKKKIKLRSVDK